MLDNRRSAEFGDPLSPRRAPCLAGPASVLVEGRTIDHQLLRDGLDRIYRLYQGSQPGCRRLPGGT